MGSLWSFLAKPDNQKLLSWLGSGLVAVAAGIWVVATHVWPSPPAPKSARDDVKVVCAQQGGIAGGRDASGNSITFNGNAPSGAGGQQASCTEAAKAP